MSLFSIIVDVIIAGLIFYGMIWIYIWGYRSGIKYCMTQLGPLEKTAREIVNMTRKK